MKASFLFTTLLLLVAAFTVTAKAEQVCGHEVKSLKAWSTSKDSSGDDRAGVIAAKDDLELALTAIALIVAQGQEAQANGQEYNLSEEERARLMKLAGGMFYCIGNDAPMSGNIIDFDQVKCQSIPNVVGLRLGAHVYTPSAQVVVTSIDLNGKVRDELLDGSQKTLTQTAPPKANTQTEDLCFETPEEVKFVMVTARSINPDGKGSRGNLFLDFLQATDIPTQKLP